MSKIDHAKLISERINYLANKKNLSRNRIAILGEIKPSTVAAIFDGNSKNPTLKTIKGVSDGLDISVTEFLDFPPYNEKRSENGETIEELMKDVQVLNSQLQILQDKLEKKIK